MTPQASSNFKIRMRPETRDWLEVKARQNSRSMTAEINHRLEEARRAEETTAGTTVSQ